VFSGTRKSSEPGEGEKNLALAFALSAGLHLIFMLTLSASPGSWQHGFQPALRVVLREVAGEAEPSASVPAIPPVAPSPEAPAVEKTPPAAEGQTAQAPREGGSMPLTGGYYRASEVDEPAVPVERGPLVFPENAYMWKLAGSVRARVFINEQGGVDSVQIVEARPRRGIFEEAAIDALRQVRYRPAQIAGRAVKSQKLIEVKFDPYEKPDGKE
jgi:protein TonB